VDRTQFFLERIYKMTAIPITMVDCHNDILLFSRGYSEKSNPLQYCLQLKKRLCEKVSLENPIALDVDEEQYVYGICADLIGNIIIFGPTSESKVNTDQLDKYRHKLGILDTDFFVKQRNLNELCATVATIASFIWEKSITEIDVLAQEFEQGESDDNFKENNRVKYRPEFFDYEENRFTYSDELNYMDAIKRGDPESVKQSASHRLESFKKSNVGKQLAQKATKQNEYMAVSAIVLASRAAIEGGLDTYNAYLISEHYMQRLELISGMNDIYKLIYDMTIRFAELVRENNISKSNWSYVEQCKNFIDKHLNKQFTIDEVADEIAVNKTYLSRKFSEETGIGIQKYAQKKRIEAAKNMLEATDFKLATIANYFCFTSQSHFGRVFKEFTGITPQAYRNQNKN